ncbi:MAG: RNA-binding protein [Acidobacteriota bacterium]
MPREREDVISAKIFVGNLSFNTTKDELEQLFAQEGSLQEVFLPTDRESGRPRGFAFVTYNSDDDAVRAIEKFNGQELGGRALRVNSADERPRRAPSFSPFAGGGGGGDSRPFGGGGGGGGGGERFGGNKPKGSRRNIRGKKRSL